MRFNQKDVEASTEPTLNQVKVDDSYRPIKTNILMLPELPKISTTYRMLQHEKKHKEISKPNTPSSDSMVFAANKRDFHDRRLSHNKHYKQSSTSSYSKPYANNDSKRHAIYFCEHCKFLAILLKGV